jgi:dynein heavy chain
LLNKYFTSEVLDNQEYKFSDSSSEYSAPSYLDIDSFVEHIRNMPIVSSPEAFGLNENAKITRDFHETQLLFNTILLTLPVEVNILFF